MKGIIVAIGYNRPDSLERCLASVVNAEYDETDSVDLYVSLDHHAMEDELERMVNTFTWKHGELKVIKHAERMGLRNHVISCGNLIGDHDLLVMLEDDIVVSENYYAYVKAAYEKYESCDNIVGISLYSPAFVLQNGRHFEPEYNGSDTYLCSHAQSWGQAWSKRMWEGFHSWYLEHQDLKKPFEMPDNAYGWDQRSWLRYFMAYASIDNHYLVYPYHALSTNMNEIGENFAAKNSDCQISIIRGKKQFIMYDYDECVKYNAHNEREEDYLFHFAYEGEKVLMDLNAIYSSYGDYRYVVSTKKMDYRIVKSYGLCRRPQEINLLEETPGDDIWLYDLSVPEKNNRESNFEHLIRYDVRAIPWTRLMYLAGKLARRDNPISHRIRRLKKKRKKK